MTIDRILSIIAITVSFIAVPASGYLSYRYAVMGERRKEFNAAADVIRAKLREQVRMINDGHFPAGNTVISDQEFESFVDVHSKNKRSRLKYLWLEYQATLDECAYRDSDGFFCFLCPDKLLEIVLKILPATERR